MKRADEWQRGGRNGRRGLEAAEPTQRRRLWWWAVMAIGLGFPVHAAVQLTEIMYHPPGDHPDEPGEFLELHQPGPEPVDLSGWRFDRGLDFTFPAGATLAPRGYVVVAKDPDWLKDQGADGTVLGPFAGGLSNGGERIRLVDADGREVLDVRYGDHGDWPAAADGAGHSLVFEDGARNPANPRAWQASRTIGGSPGRADDPSSEAPETVTLIEVGSPGVYFKGTEEPSGGDTSWAGPDYAPDDRWLAGPSGYGYSSEAGERADLRTLLDDMRGQYASVYARLSFQLSAADLARVERLTLTMIYDDGYVAYLNGERVRATNVSGDPPRHDTLANWGADYTPETVDLTPRIDLLRAGENVLAVQGHNGNLGNSSDFLLSPRLTADLAQPSVADDPARAVVFNEVFAASGADPDWVELFNPTDQPIDLSGAWLSDDPDQLAQFALPAGTVVPAGGFLWLSQDTFGFGLSTAGEQVLLTEPGGEYVLAALGFGPQTPGVSLARWPDGAEDWFRTDSPTPGAPNQVARSAGVVLNELMYHDPVDGRYEFVELRNVSDADVDLSGWEFRGIDFEFPEGASLPAGGYLVVADDREAFTERYGTVDGALWGDYAGGLDNGGETLSLVDADDVVQDQVAYDDRGDWPVTPDGDGASLERACVGPAFADPFQWVASPPDRPSPGAPNHAAECAKPAPSPLAIMEVMYHPFATTDDDRRTEFIELLNRGETSVELAGWRVLGDTELAFPAGAVLPPGGRALVAFDPERLRAVYPVGDVPVFGPLARGLPNGGGEILLVNPGGRLADEVVYGDDFPWPSVADGYGAVEGIGHSLERLCPDLPGDAPANWVASPADLPTPGRPNTLETCAPGPQVTALRLTPFPVTADAEPVLSVRLARGEPAQAGAVEYWVDDPEIDNEPHQSASLQRDPDDPGLWSATLAQWPENSIVRYRVSFDLADGGRLESPAPERDAFAWHAYFVDPLLTTQVPWVYHLFLSSADWARLHQWTGPGRVSGGQPNPNWNNEVPATFVCDGVVYDVTVRHQGSRWGRNGGATISFACPSHRTDGQAQVRSWRIRFPSYRRCHGKDVLILQKRSGWPQRVSFRMFELAGVPAPRTSWARLQINGCDYNPVAYEIERPGRDLVERWFGEVGDLFKSVGYTGNEGPWSWGDERLITGARSGFSETRRYKYTYDRKTRTWLAPPEDETMDLVEPLIEGLHQARAQGPAALRAYLAGHFDVDEVLRYMCTINYVGTFDDMFQNHFLYHSLADDKWRMMPWDMDNTLGGAYGEWNANPFRGADQARINADPILRDTIGNIGNRQGWWNRLKDSFFIAYQDEFLRKFLELNNTVFAPENLGLVIEEIGAELGASSGQMSRLKDHVQRRHDYLNQFMTRLAPQEATLEVRPERRGIRLRWPAWLVGYGLESAPALDGPWEAVGETPEVGDGFYEVMEAATDRARFYRLRAAGP